MELLNFLYDSFCKVYTYEQEQSLLKKAAKKTLKVFDKNSKIFHETCNNRVEFCVEEICNQYGNGVNPNWKKGEIPEPDKFVNYFILVPFCNSFGGDGGKARRDTRWLKAVRYIYKKQNPNDNNGPNYGPCNKYPKELGYSPVEKYFYTEPSGQNKMVSDNFDFEKMFLPDVGLKIGAAAVYFSETPLKQSKNEILSMFGVENFLDNVNAVALEEEIIEEKVVQKKVSHRKIGIDIMTGEELIYEGGKLVVFPSVFGVPTLPSLAPVFGGTLAPVFAY